MLKTLETVILVDRSMVSAPEGLTPIVSDGLGNRWCQTLWV